MKGKKTLVGIASGALLYASTFLGCATQKIGEEVLSENFKTKSELLNEIHQGQFYFLKIKDKTLSPNKLEVVVYNQLFDVEYRQEKYSVLKVQEIEVKYKGPVDEDQCTKDLVLLMVTGVLSFGIVPLIELLEGPLPGCELKEHTEKQLREEKIKEYYKPVIVKKVQLLNENPAPNIPLSVSGVKISSTPVTDENGKAIIYFELPNNFSYTKAELKDTPVIKKLYSLGIPEESIKLLLENPKRSDLEIKIKTNVENPNIINDEASLTLYGVYAVDCSLVNLLTDEVRCEY